MCRGVSAEAPGGFTTAANLVNELVEAKHQLQLRRVLARWERYDVIAIDEVGYVPLAEVGAEFLFQVIAERAEKAAVILTTNLPFSEWTQVIPNARLCKALLDRITDRAHIIDTGSESFRFRRTLALRQRTGWNVVRDPTRSPEGLSPLSIASPKRKTNDYFYACYPEVQGGQFPSIKVGHTGLTNTT